MVGEVVRHFPVSYVCVILEEGGGPIHQEHAAGAPTALREALCCRANAHLHPRSSMKMAGLPCQAVLMLICQQLSQSDMTSTDDALLQYSDWRGHAL